MERIQLVPSEKASYVFLEVHATFTRVVVDCCWQLHNCVAKSLEAADSLKVQSITIPSISTGIFGGESDLTLLLTNSGEIDLCSKLIVYSIAEYFQENPASSVKEVVLLSWDEERLISFDVQANSVWKKGISSYFRIKVIWLRGCFAREEILRREQKEGNGREERNK